VYEYHTYYYLICFLAGLCCDAEMRSKRRDRKEGRERCVGTQVSSDLARVLAMSRGYTGAGYEEGKGMGGLRWGCVLYGFHLCLGLGVHGGGDRGAMDWWCILFR